MDGAFHVQEGNRMKERDGGWAVWNRDGCHPRLREKSQTEQHTG